MLEKTIEKIAPLDTTLLGEIHAHLDNLTKPPGSLGYLEKIAAQYCLITNTTCPVLGRKIIFTFAADHGVASRGVSAFPKEVTPQMVRNMLNGGSGVNVLARHAGAETRVVDIGVDDPLDGAEGLIRRKVRSGSGDISQGPAMSMEEARQAIQVGIDLALEAAREGFTLIGTGEMGIGNTTPSSALFAALLPCPVEEITGRGTGIDDAVLERKTSLIRQALEVNSHSLSSPLKALAALGGLEIAGICGLILGAASQRVPVVVDGFISSAAALCACRLCPQVRGYLFFSHFSAEAGYARFAEMMGIRPILDLDMRLGEGTGAALAMQIIEAAVKIYNEMATFNSAGVTGEST
jgi:nicotinate-nucleotide--dimethylbenzimidazole phosphoribosyltransferase